TRSTDASFRYGGDEFAIILPDADLDYGRALADRLRIFIGHNPVVIGDLEIPVTISLGVVVFDNEKTAGDLIQKADDLLYRAKNEGRNLVR
ncbi:MAG: GGDEF domain-containing protein, partial [bacterium]